jgi:glycosyltransferase involved in cell wall biosynthesis
MRLLYVNWAPLWKGAALGGGANLYQQSVAVEMAKRGHRVSSVSSGWEYNYAGGPYLRRGPDWDGVENWVIVNARTLAPGFFNFRDPELDVHEPAAEALFTRVLNGLQPDVVHFNNLEGFTPRCISIAQARGPRVVCSLHNYHPLCSQVHLLYRDRELCDDYEEGVRCTRCSVPPPRAAELRRRRAEGFAASLPHGHLLLTRLRRLRDLGRAAYAASVGPAQLARQGWERLVSRSRETRSLPQRAWEARAISAPPPADPGAAAGYARRREAFLGALNQADLLLAVSGSVGDIYRKMGVHSMRMRVSHIGTAIAHQRPPHRTRSPGSSDPLKLVYLGTTAPAKGLSVLLDALTALGSEQLGRVRLHLFGLGSVDAELEGRLSFLTGRLAGLQVREAYRRDELPVLLRDADFGVVPPLWWDCAPQVVFEMLALGVPVLGARIGGIPDFVHDGVNGHLFEPGDARELARRIASFVESPEQIEELRAGIRPLKTISEHILELEALYRDDAPR